MKEFCGKTFFSKKIFGILILLVTSFFWGTTFVSGRVLVRELTVSNILFYRVLISCFAILILFPKLLKKEILSAFGNYDVALFSIVGALATITQTQALEFSSASHVAFISSLFVIFVPMLEFIIYGKTFKKIFYLAVALSLAGIYMISFGFELPETFGAGNFLALLSAIGYAYYLIKLEKISTDYSGPTLIFHFFFIMGVMSFIYCMATGTLAPLSEILKPSILLNIACLALLGGILPYILMVVGQRIIPAHIATLVYNFEPVFASLLAFLLIGEKFTFPLIIGAGAIFVSLLIGSRLK